MEHEKPIFKHPNRRWLTWEVFGFGLTSFFSDLSHEVATTLLPLFLASLGAPAYAVGVIEGVADGIASLGKLFGGWFSDKKGKRKKLAVIGYLITGLTQGLYCFATVWVQAFMFRVVGWLGRGWRSPIRDALFHDSVTTRTSGRAFGFERMMDTVGAVLAPLLAYFLLPKIGFRGVFALTWIPGILAVLSFIFLVRERKIHHPEKKSLWLSIQGLPPDYFRFLVAVTLFGLADFSHALMIFWAGVLLTPEYGIEKASSIAILLYVLHNAVYAVSTYPAGRIADKIGKFRVLAFGYFLACVMFLGLMFNKGDYGWLIFLFALRGFYMAIEDTLERAIAGDLLDSRVKGTGYGFLASLNGFGDLLSSVLVGILLSAGSSKLAFGYCFVCAFLGFLMLVLTRRRPPAPTNA